MNKLDKYKEKRDFNQTAEPDDSAENINEPFFVVQRHEASSLHFDFRLSIDGVLKSWAVPKGPSLDPSEKRLAMRTEDHPINYADFEGTIPEDQYGGGSVIIWDRGTFENITEKNGNLKDATQAVKDGELIIKIDGERISGGYALVRIDDEEDRWLLIKKDDDKADRRSKPEKTELTSVVSGKTNDEVTNESVNNNKEES